MVDIRNTVEPCTICRHEYTSIHAEADPGVKIYVCESCLEAARYNFIFVCMHCGKVHVVHKMQMIRKIQDENLRHAYLQCINEQIIQGIDRCVSCDPEGILHYMQCVAKEC